MPRTALSHQLTPPQPRHQGAEATEQQDARGRLGHRTPGSHRATVAAASTGSTPALGVVMNSTLSNSRP